VKRYVKLRISAFIAFLAILNMSIFAPLAPCFASVPSEICQIPFIQAVTSHEGHGEDEAMPDHSLHSAGHEEAMEGGHCGMAEDKEGFPAASSGHQCMHHNASSKGSDIPSLYCNCQVPGSNSAVNVSQQETRYLEPSIVTDLPDVAHDVAQPFTNIFISNFHPDPIEKPPTFA